MSIRSTQANRLYHELATQLYRSPCVKVWDGRFTALGYPNPVVIRLSAFSYDTARELLKALDLEFPRDSKQKVLSSAKLTTEEMNSHITFLQILTQE